MASVVRMRLATEAAFWRASPTSVAIRWGLDNTNNFTKDLTCSDNNNEVGSIPLALGDTVLSAKLASIGALGAMVRD